MPYVPSLVEETGRTCCGILLLYNTTPQQNENLYGFKNNNKNNKSNRNSPPSSIGNTNFLTTAATSSTTGEGTVPQHQQAENMILDNPIQFLSQIRSFVPSNFFAKKVHATDFRILAAQCQAVVNSHPGEILSSWIENLCRNDITVNDLVVRVRETRLAKERLRKREEEEKKAKKEEIKKEKEELGEYFDEEEYDKFVEEEENKKKAMSDKYLAEITGSSALQMIQQAVSPLNAARALFSSLYCFILQISAAVWSALERASKEKAMEKLSNRNSNQQQGGAATTTSSSSSRSYSSSAIHSSRVQTTSQLPPLVGVRRRPGSSSSTAQSGGRDDTTADGSRPVTSSTCDTSFLRTSQFQLDHSRQKLQGLPRRPPKPIRSSFHKNIHDNIAAVKSDELRSHVPLLNQRSKDSSSSWELACLDFSDKDYPRLVQLTQLQQAYGAEVLESHYLEIVPQQLLEESEKEIVELCAHVQQVIDEIFESSPTFLAPAFTQCLVILRGWFKNNNVTSDNTNSSLQGSSNGTSSNMNRKTTTKRDEAAANQSLHEPASAASCALLGIQPRVPNPYCVNIDGSRSVFIPHPLPSHTILVANALRHQSMLKMEKQKHQLKMQRAKNEKILELQRAALRPKNEPRPAPHVPGRNRRQELGLETEGDSASTLEKVLSHRFSSATTSVLKKRKF